MRQIPRGNCKTSCILSRFMSTASRTGHDPIPGFSTSVAGTRKEKGACIRAPFEQEASLNPGTCTAWLWLLPSGPDQAHQSAMRGDPPKLENPETRIPVPGHHRKGRNDSRKIRINPRKYLNLISFRQIRHPGTKRQICFAGFLSIPTR
jgi:hypothetical protein